MFPVFLFQKIPSFTMKIKSKNITLGLIQLFEKLVYLAYRNIRKKWTMPLANWAIISQQLAIKFGERFKLL